MQNGPHVPLVLASDSLVYPIICIFSEKSRSFGGSFSTCELSLEKHGVEKK